MEINLLWRLYLQDPDRKYEILGLLLLSSWAGFFHLLYFSFIKNQLKKAIKLIFLTEVILLYLGKHRQYLTAASSVVYFKNAFYFKGSLPRWWAPNPNELLTCLFHSDADLTSKILPATPGLKNILWSYTIAKGFLKSTEIMSTAVLLSAVIVTS